MDEYNVWQQGEGVGQDYFEEVSGFVHFSEWENRWITEYSAGFAFGGRS